jgi:hypothetical protein
VSFSIMPMLAAIEFDQDPISYADLPRLLTSWVQDAGGFAAVALGLWIMSNLFRPIPTVGTTRKPVSILQAICFAVSILCYAVAALLRVRIALATNQETYERIAGQLNWLMIIAGIVAIIGFIEPFILDFLRLRLRRIFAIAKLSYKEAVRRRVVWVFLAFLLIFLFPAKWFFPIKAEDELKTNISVIYYGMSPMMTLVGLLLAAFAIPSDVKSQTIHTIVTKPVERFEIVLGRFLGYLALLTVAIFGLSTISLLLIEASNVDPRAREESMKSRDPVYGFMSFESKREGASFQGVNVGREREYRKYIGGASSHRAIYSFSKINSNMANQEYVPMEFQFDIYRTTKGEENKGVPCSFEVISHRWNEANRPAYEDDIRKMLGKLQSSGSKKVAIANISPPTAKSEPAEIEAWKEVNAIAEKYGRFEWRSLDLYDYHTYSILVPPGVYKNATEKEPTSDAFQTPTGPALIQVRVRAEQPSQYLGTAKWDLYLLRSEGSFWLNFYKGSLGLWCRLVIVVMLAVACSTYLAGVISFLIAFSLFILGFFLDFIRSLAFGQNVGGGPLESLTRLVKGEVATSYVDPSSVLNTARSLDELFRWPLRRVVNVIPDVDAFGWSNYVALGFNVPLEFIIMNLLVLSGYVFPVAIIAYYLMRSREIAA